MSSDSYKLGDIVELEKKTTFLKKSTTKEYEFFTTSKYVCVREATEGQKGILFKALGIVAAGNILFVNGEPFCKDDKLEGLYADLYSSFRFPDVEELKEVLDIIRDNSILSVKFAEASMRVDTGYRYWVRNTAKRFLFLKKAQYYDWKKNELATANSEDEIHHRLTIAYF